MNDHVGAARPDRQEGSSDSLTRHAIESFLTLEHGDFVEAWDNDGVRWHGTIDLIDQDIGVLWIHTQLGERKLLDIHEHTIRRM